jgi:hypothetical protein
MFRCRTRTCFRIGETLVIAALENHEYRSPISAPAIVCTMDQTFTTQHGPITVGEHFITEEKPRMIAIYPIKEIIYLGHPKEWSANSSVQFFVGTLDQSIFFDEMETAMAFKDAVLAAIARSAG